MDLLVKYLFSIFLGHMHLFDAEAGAMPFQKKSYLSLENLFKILFTILLSLVLPSTTNTCL
jgi:hypothetical protein